MTRDRLYRSREDRVVFGVAGGVADWLDIDPSLVRIGFVLATLGWGFGLLLYIVMAIVVPEDPLMATDEHASAPVAGGDGTSAPLPATPSTPVMDARAARRAARQQRGAERGGQGALIFGAVLILIGGWAVLRRYLPAIDGDLLGPAVLLLIGVILVAGALRRSGDAG